MKQLFRSLPGRLGMWLLVFLPALVSAQSVNYSIKGTVTDESGSPLAGVSVVLVEARQATFSDDRGFYDLSGAVAEGSYTLEFRYFSFQTERRAITIALGKASFNENVTLGGDILKLDEVIVTGNSPTATRKQLGNYVGVVDGRSLEKSGSVNPLGALAGKVAGAQISQNQGDPAGGFSIQLRGANSIKGSSDPLYIVDGVIVDNSSQNVINLSGDAMTTSFQAGQNRLVDINPNDIERVEVLNGASAAALYGSRASNGVVQIFTKRGRASKPTLEFSTSAGISQLRQKVFFTTYGKRFGLKGNDRLETAQDRLTILLTNGLTETQLQSAGANYVKVGSVNRILVTDQYDVKRYDYQDEIFQSAFGTESYLSLTGGNERSNYYASLGYTNNDGIVKNTNFTKYTGRLRLNQTLNKWMSFSTGLSYTVSRSKDMPNGNNFFSPMSTIFIIDNVWDITERNADGTLKQVEQVRMNPLTVIETFDITQRTNRSIADIGLKIFPCSGLRFDYTLGVDHYSLRGNEYHPRVPYAGVAATFFPDGYVAFANSSVMQYNSDLLATYDAKLGPLTSTTTAGYQYQYVRADFTGQEGRDLAPLIKNISAASNLFTTSQQAISQLSVSGYFLQQTFGYDDQVYLTLAGRVDGSSAFSTDNQSNFYPKASLSWVASRLFANSGLSRTIGTLKLRASYGQAGNLTGIGPYDRFNNFPGTLLTGLPAITPPRALNNPDAKPEVMTETEAGADLAFLRNRIGLSFTWYNQEVDNLLFNRPLPPSIGGTSIVTNVGAMSNKGIEILLQAQAVRTANFSWDLGFNYSANRNEVSGVDGVLSLRGSDGTQSALNGEPFGVFFGRYYARNDDGTLLLTSQGLAQPERGLVILESKYDENTLPSGALKDRIYHYAGSVYVPVRDGNGQPQTTGGTQELRKVLGNPYPDWIGSVTSAVTWKKITLNFQFDAFMGAEIYNWNRITSNNVGFGELAEKELKGEVARGYVASVAGGVTGQRIQEEHIEDASYIKLRELGLSYNFGRVGRAFENLSLSLLGRNLLSFDDYKGFDPETNSAGQNDRVRGDDFGNVPIPRTYMVRLNARF